MKMATDSLRGEQFAADDKCSGRAIHRTWSLCTQEPWHDIAPDWHRMSCVAVTRRAACSWKILCFALMSAAKSPVDNDDIRGSFWQMLFVGSLEFSEVTEWNLFSFLARFYFAVSLKFGFVAREFRVNDSLELCERPKNLLGAWPQSKWPTSNWPLYLIFLSCENRIIYTDSKGVVVCF